MSIHRKISRPLLAAPFVADGIDAIRRPNRHADKVERMRPTLERLGVPAAILDNPALVARVTGALTTLAGVRLALSRSPRTSAFALAALMAPVTAVRYPVWLADSKDERSEMVAGLLRDAGLLGGLFIAAADREGEPSLRWKIANKAEHRADRKELKADLKDKYDD